MIRNEAKLRLVFLLFQETFHNNSFFFLRVCAICTLAIMRCSSEQPFSINLHLVVDFRHDATTGFVYINVYTYKLLITLS
jgi:hypothetical protein